MARSVSAVMVRLGFTPTGDLLAPVLPEPRAQRPGDLGCCRHGWRHIGRSASGYAIDDRGERIEGQARFAAHLPNGAFG
jgi:hypothetical protein